MELMDLMEKTEMEMTKMEMTKMEIIKMEIIKMEMIKMKDCKVIHVRWGRLYRPGWLGSTRG